MTQHNKYTQKRYKQTFIILKNNQLAIKQIIAMQLYTNTILNTFDKKLLFLSKYIKEYDKYTT